MSSTRCLALLCSLGLLWACGSDDSEPAGSGGGSATGGSATGGSATGGNATGGSATGGSATGGAGGSAAGGGAGEGSGGSLATPLNPRHVVAPGRAFGPGAGGAGGADSAGGAGGAGSGSRLLVAGTDFFTSTEIATIDLEGGSVSGSVTFADGDAVPAASYGLAFALERTNDQVHLIGQTGAIQTSIDVSALPTEQTVALGDKAYVLLYNTNSIGVLDLAAGTLAGLIDLSEFVASDDSDGWIELDKAVFDPDTGRLYVTLARIDRNTIVSGLVCPSDPALVVGIDVSTDALVDLNGGQPGTAIELDLSAPVDLALDDAGRRLLILASGCFGDGTEPRERHGIEAVSLTSFTTETLVAESTGDFLNRLLWLDTGGAIVNGFDADFIGYHKRWNGSDAALGAALNNVPTALSYAGGETFFGMDFDGGATVVRYSSQTETSTPVLSDPWQGNFDFAGGSVVVP